MGRIFETRKATMFARWDKMSKAFTRVGKELSIAVRAGGPNPDNAKLFLDFISSREAHSIAAGKPFFRRSVRKDVAPPPGLRPTAEIKFFDYDVEKAATEKSANLKKFDEIMAAK